MLLWLTSVFLVCVSTAASFEPTLSDDEATRVNQICKARRFFLNCLNVVDCTEPFATQKVRLLGVSKSVVVSKEPKDPISALHGVEYDADESAPFQGTLGMYLEKEGRVPVLACQGGQIDHRQGLFPRHCFAR